SASQSNRSAHRPAGSRRSWRGTAAWCKARWSQVEAARLHHVGVEPGVEHPRHIAIGEVAECDGKHRLAAEDLQPGDLMLAVLRVVLLDGGAGDAPLADDKLALRISHPLTLLGSIASCKVPHQTHQRANRGAEAKGRAPTEAQDDGGHQPR